MMQILDISLFSLLFSACSAAVYPFNQEFEQISRSASDHDLSSRSDSFETAQLSISSTKSQPQFSPKPYYLKRSDLTEFKRDLLIDRPLTVILAEEEQKQKQQLKPKKQKNNENFETCSQVCAIS